MGHGRAKKWITDGNYFISNWIGSSKNPVLSGVKYSFKGYSAIIVDNQAIK
ncbi:MAG: hypothetical protein RH949_30970 [Coleofasciculus sp. A1-SPW-01]